MTFASKFSLRQFLLATSVAASLGVLTQSADAQGLTKVYDEVPSAAQLSQDLFGHKPQIRTRGLRAGGGIAAPRTRGIRWREEQVAAAPVPAPVQELPSQQASAPVQAVDVSPEPVQTASLEATAPAPEKLAFNIQFHFNSTEMKADSAPFIDRLGEVLNAPENLGSPLMIVGHTDAKGSDAYNMQLSIQRAAAIRDYLVRFWGVDPSTLTVDARGESEPLAGVDPFDAANRRVEFWALNG